MDLNDGIYCVTRFKHKKGYKPWLMRHTVRFGTLSLAMAHCKQNPPKADETLAIYWHERHTSTSMAVVSIDGDIQLTDAGREHLAYEGGI